MMTIYLQRQTIIIILIYGHLLWFVIVLKTLNLFQQMWNYYFCLLAIYVSYSFVVARLNHKLLQMHNHNNLLFWSLFQIYFILFWAFLLLFMEIRFNFHTKHISDIMFIVRMWIKSMKTNYHRTFQMF